MPIYQYKAVDATGKELASTVEANTEQEAGKKIRDQGLFPMQGSIREKKGKGSKGADPTKAKKKGKGITLDIPIGRVNLKKLTLFTRQLSTLQAAGLPLLRSLQILESQQKGGRFKRILKGVTEEVEAGTTLSDSMAKHPRAFDRLYCKMVAAGEIGGVLDIILQRLADFMEKGQRLRRRIKGAMIYPAVVITIAVLIVTGIMYFVIPKFQEIFNDFDVKLPELTLFLIDASRWVAGQNQGQNVPGAVWVVFSPFIIFGLYKLIRIPRAGRAATDWIFLKIPVIGNLMKKTSVARFTRTLGTLIAAGVPIEAISQVSHHVAVPGQMLRAGAEHYALEVKGDSMIDAGINDGDIVVIRETDTADDGDIVVALVEGQEATLKRFLRRGASIALEAANPAYETRVYPSDMVAVQGRLVGLIRSY